MAVIDEPFANRFFGSPAAAVGKRIRFFFGGEEWNEIVGVVAHVQNSDPATAGNPQVYVPFPQQPTASAHLVIRTTTRDAILMRSVRQEVQRLDRTLPIYDVATMRFRLANSIKRERVSLQLFGIFAAITLTLAVVGVYSVIALAMERRTREIGIRVALGATRGSILKMVVGAGTMLAAWGAVFGIAGAALLSRFAETMLFGISPLDVTTFVMALVAIISVGILASLIPSRRALRVDPIVAIRAD